jgi:translation initiation factor IF-3
VISFDGEQLGVMQPSEALRLARERELDLVEIAPTAKPPVVRIMDFGKYKFELAKKERVARKKQHITVLKGIRLSPLTDDHDLMTKVAAARKFIEDGAKVKASIMFRGRMVTHQDFGVRMLNRMATELADVAKVESAPKMEGPRMMAMMLMKK